MSYDAKGERVSIVEEVDFKKDKTFYEFILLHQEVCTGSLLFLISLLEIPGVNLIKLLQKQVKNVSKWWDAIDDETIVSLQNWNEHQHPYSFVSAYYVPDRTEHKQDW